MERITNQGLQIVIGGKPVLTLPAGRWACVYVDVEGPHPHQHPEDLWWWMLSLPVSALELPTRTANALSRWKADNPEPPSIEELPQASDKDLLMIKSFGKGCLKDVDGALGAMGLTRGKSLPNDPQRSRRMASFTLL